MLKVSIITPSYNQASFLETTIRSVLSQGYQDLEYFIVDGGSTDGSVEIIRKYGEDLAGWISEPDKGQADAINKGFQKATGDLIAWLNSDDAYAPGTIRSVVEVFNTEPNVGLVYGNAVSVDHKGLPFYEQVFSEYRLRDLVAFRIICQPAVFLRKEILDEVGGLDDRYHYLLDHHLWLRIAQRTVMKHKPEIWAFARYHPGAKNIRLALEFSEEAFQLLQWMKAQPGLADIIAQEYGEVMGRANRFSARYLLDGGKAWASLKAYARAFRYSPRVAIEEWHRVLFAGLSTLGLARLGDLYYRLRNDLFSPVSLGLDITNIDCYYRDIDL